MEIDRPDFGGGSQGGQTKAYGARSSAASGAKQRATKLKVRAKELMDKVAKSDVNAFPEPNYGSLVSMTESVEIRFESVEHVGVDVWLDIVRIENSMSGTIRLPRC